MKRIGRISALCALILALPVCAEASNIVRMNVPIVEKKVDVPPNPGGGTETDTDPTPEPQPSALNGRYWRILITAINGSTGYAAIQEIEFHKTPGGSDITTPATPASASSFYSTLKNTALKSVDDNFTDYAYSAWVSASNADAPHWLSYDLGSPVDVTEIMIWPQYHSLGNTRAPKDFSVETSNDGTTWRTVKTFSGVTKWSYGTPKSFSLE